MTDSLSPRPDQSAFPPLVEVDWLALQRPENFQLVDLRWSAKPDGAEKRYLEGHIPGAVRVDLDRDLAQPGGPGRHPFPPAERLAATLGRLGIGSETHVVIYDDGPGQYAARLWYMLRVHGHQRASVLNGGLAAWKAAGHPLSTLAEAPEHASPPTLRLDSSRLVDRSELKHLLKQRGPLVLDARARPRYRGEVEPLDAKKGHIPGVVNAPFEENLRSAEDPRLRPPHELRATFEALGVPAATEVVVSCGSGVTACHDALALELAGLGLPRLYVGSFSDWIASGEPIAIGSEPGKLE